MPSAPFSLVPPAEETRIPLRLYRVLGVRGIARELVRIVAQVACRFNPLVRAGWRRAALILVQNEETRQALPRRYRSRANGPAARIRPWGDRLRRCDASLVVPPETERRIAVSAGRLLPWKGLSLVIRALEQAPEWELVVIGRGPERDRLQRLVDRRGLGDCVRFVPWMEQPDLWTLLSSADALVLPSLRDDAPLVVAEALMLGLPVVAFDQKGGAAVLAQTPGARVSLVPQGSEDVCVQGLAQALRALARLSPGHPPDFSVGKVADELDSVYRRVVNGGPPR